MNHFAFRLLVVVSFAFVGNFVGNAHVNAAQPYATLQCSSAARLQSVLTELEQLKIAPGAVEQLNSLLSRVQGLVDRSRPFGGFVMPSTPDADMVFFVPTKPGVSIHAALAALKFDVKQLEDGVLRIDAGRDLFVLQHGNWCCLAGNRELLKGLPAAPTAWSAGMNGDFTLKVNMRSMPHDLRTRGIDRIASWFVPDESLNAETHQLIPRFSTAGVVAKELARAAAESDVVRVAVTKTAAGVDCQIELDGQRVSRLFSRSTRHGAAHLPDARSVGAYRTTLSDAQAAWIDRWSRSVSQVFSAGARGMRIEKEEGQAEVVQMIREVSETVRNVALRGDLDVAFVELGEQARRTVAYGIHLDRSEQVMDRMLAMAEQAANSGGPVRELRLGKSRGQQPAIHTFLAPSDLAGGNNPDLWKRVAVAATRDSLWIACGEQAETALARVTDRGAAVQGPLNAKLRWGSSPGGQADLAVRSKLHSSRVEIHATLSLDALQRALGADPDYANGLDELDGLDGAN